MWQDWGVWDGILIGVVSIQALALACLYHPRWKALLLSLPLPFTCAALAVGQPVDATNVVGLALLLGFTYGVMVLHVYWRVPIFVAIVLSAGGYAGVGTLLARWLPKGDAAFWVATGLVLLLAVALLVVVPHREEPGHRTPLPVWLKLPLIVAVVFGLVTIKRYLGGFVTVFPMVGVIAAYEARKCLWTISRQIPVVMVTILVLIVVCRLVQPRAGLPWALAAGWVAFLAVLLPLTRYRWRAEDRRATDPRP
jgi:hypothetical protein